MPESASTLPVPPVAAARDHTRGVQRDNRSVAAMLLVALLIAAAAPASADPPRITRTTTVFGDDPCPTATNDEIVVCGRLPEAERFRIPQKLRKPKNERVARPWSAQNDVLDDVARLQRPDSCSVVGDGGQTGCTAAMLRQWAAERRAGLGMPR